jgi:hypothetical protein
MNDLELSNTGESVKIIDGFFECFLDQISSIFPLENPKICSLCFIHLEISFNFRKKCLESNKMLYEHHLANQQSALLSIKSELELEIGMDEEGKDEGTELLVKLDNPSLNLHEENKLIATMQLNRIAQQPKRFVKKHRCPICRKTFNFPSVLTKHIASHARRKCLKCDRTFLRYTQLDKHMTVDHGTGEVHKEHKCHLCGKNFPFQSVLHRHLNHHNKYKCEHCNMGFTRMSNLDEHYEKCHPQMSAVARAMGEVKKEDSFSEYTLGDGEVSSTATAALSEQDSLAGISLEKSGNLYSTGKHSCHLCDKVFDFRSVLLKHISCHNKHVCSHCNMGFTRSTLLEEHIEEEHQQTLQTATKDAVIRKELRCTICDKVFYFHNVLYKHIARHDQARNMFLEKSDAASTNTATKRKHECKLCGKVSCVYLYAGVVTIYFKSSG